MNTPNRNSRKMLMGRLKLIGAGLILAAVGLARLRGGIEVVRHGIGQPMFSWGIIAGGGVCFVLAFIPISWVAKAAGESGAKHRRVR